MRTQWQFRGFIVVNAAGEPWSPEAFATREAAAADVEEQLEVHWVTAEATYGLRIVPVLVTAERQAA